MSSHDVGSCGSHVGHTYDIHMCLHLLTCVSHVKNVPFTWGNVWNWNSTCVSHVNTCGTHVGHLWIQCDFSVREEDGKIPVSTIAAPLHHVVALLNQNHRTLQWVHHQRTICLIQKLYHRQYYLTINILFPSFCAPVSFGFLDCIENPTSNTGFLTCLKLSSGRTTKEKQKILLILLLRA